VRKANGCNILVMCSLFLFGGSWSATATPEVSMSSEQAGQSQEATTRNTIDKFNNAFNLHDADRLATLLSDDTVFEDTSPAPDGRRVEGKAAVVEFWRGWFMRNADARFDAEDVIVSGSRATVLWVYHKMRNGQPWHIRGVDFGWGAYLQPHFGHLVGGGVRSSLADC
jgi:ketosteroid isomerase-like protein